jgi:hypothetical protein
LWDRNNRHIRWVIAASSSVAIGHAALEAAVANYPDQRFTLRNGILVIREHVPKDMPRPLIAAAEAWQRDRTTPLPSAGAITTIAIDAASTTTTNSAFTSQQHCENPDRIPKSVTSSASKIRDLSQATMKPATRIARQARLGDDVSSVTTVFAR